MLASETYNIAQHLIKQLFFYTVLYTDEIPWFIGNQIIDDLAKRFLGYHKPVYAVVIDAGSTGSRVLAYTFHKSYFGKSLN